MYVNKLACFVALGKYDRAVVECNDAARLIKNFRNRFEEKCSDQEKARLQRMEFNVLLRRASSLAQLTKSSEAIADYERALKLAPDE